MAAAAAVAAAGGADVPLAAQHQQASPPIQQQHLELQQQQEQAEQPAHSQPQQEELIPSGSRQQPASATTAGLTAVELGTARLLCAVRSGRSIGESILQPQVTAWQKEAQRRVDSLRTAHDSLESLSEPAGACARDAEMLEAALAQLTDVERAGAAAATLHEALSGVRRCKYLRPQAVQLISTTKAEWGVKQSASIAADSLFAQHLPVLAHAFQLAVGSLLLQQSIQQLPSLDGVPRLQHLGISAPAQQPSKPLPPSKAARLELTVVWQALVVFLTSLGTLAACCRRLPLPLLTVLPSSVPASSKPHALSLPAPASRALALWPAYPLLVQGWRASCATTQQQRGAVCRRVPSSATPHWASLMMARQR